MCESGERQTITSELFAAAAANVLADLFGAEEPLVEVRWIPPAAEAELGQLDVRAADGEGFGYWIHAEMRDEDLRYTLAERVPEYLPELAVTWGRALPPCPGHGHPAEPGWDEDAEQALWRCPLDGRRLARIGALHQTSG